MINWGWPMCRVITIYTKRSVRVPDSKILVLNCISLSSHYFDIAKYPYIEQEPYYALTGIIINTLNDDILIYFVSFSKYIILHEQSEKSQVKIYFLQHGFNRLFRHLVSCYKPQRRCIGAAATLCLVPSINKELQATS